MRIAIVKYHRGELKEEDLPLAVELVAGGSGYAIRFDALEFDATEARFSYRGQHVMSMLHDRPTDTAAGDTVTLGGFNGSVPLNITITRN